MELPGPMTVFALALLSYFFVISGIVYDVIMEPPGLGSRQDPNTGAVAPVVFMAGRVNGQYIIEGLSAGFMLVLGGLSLISLHLATGKGLSQTFRQAYLGAGAAGLFISYQMSLLFLRIKVPGYLYSSS